MYKMGITGKKEIWIPYILPNIRRRDYNRTGIVFQWATDMLFTEDQFQLLQYEKMKKI